MLIGECVSPQCVSPYRTVDSEVDRERRERRNPNEERYVNEIAPIRFRIAALRGVTCIIARRFVSPDKLSLRNPRKLCTVITRAVV